MNPDVEGVNFRLGFRRFVTVIVMMVVAVVVVVMVVSMVVVVVMMGGLFVGLLRVLKTGTFMMMMMMMVVIVLVQMLLFVDFVGLFRVLKTGTLIVVVMMMIVVIVQVSPGERRQGHPQHHQEQPEGDVYPDIFRVRFLWLDGNDGASPPHLGVIHHTRTSGTTKVRFQAGTANFHDGAPEKIFTRHVV